MQPEAQGLLGRTAIITGASRGIGRAIALEFARRGANIVVAARTTVATPPWAVETIQDTAHRITASGGRAIAVAVDVRDEAKVRSMVAAAVSAFGGVDVLVNNAAAFKMKPASSTAPREFQLVVDVNLVGAFTCIASCLPHLSASRSAHILNISPPLRTEAYWAEGKLSHATSKLALTVMTLGLAGELRAARIAVNSLWPKTIVATAGIERLGGPALLRSARRPEVMAEAAAAIVSSPASARTGECMLDEDVLRAAGVEDFTRFAMVPGAQLAPNYFVDATAVVDGDVADPSDRPGATPRR
jgi:citronellol/citronellal dehydrogenase